MCYDESFEDLLVAKYGIVVKKHVREVDRFKTPCCDPARPCEFHKRRGDIITRAKSVVTVFPIVAISITHISLASCAGGSAQTSAQSSPGISHPNRPETSMTPPLAFEHAD